MSWTIASNCLAEPADLYFCPAEVQSLVTKLKQIYSDHTDLYLDSRNGVNNIDMFAVCARDGL